MSDSYIHWKMLGWGPMSGKNRRLVTDEPGEFEK